MVKNSVEKFSGTGSVFDDVESRQSKARSARSPEVIEEARRIVEGEPSIPSRRLSSRLNVSQTTAMKLLTEDLKLFPYKIQVAQQLTDAADEKRFKFAGELCRMIDGQVMDINRIIFTDEAYFWLDGYVNRQNYRIWGTQKPELLRTKPLHPKKLTVRCGLCSEGTVGPWFIESSITSEMHHDMLLSNVLLQLRDRHWIDGFYFQHDRAPPHTTRLNLELLKQHFGS